MGALLGATGRANGDAASRARHATARNINLESDELRFYIAEPALYFMRAAATFFLRRLPVTRVPVRNAYKDYW